MCSISQEAEAVRGSRMSGSPLLLGSIFALIVALVWKAIPSMAAFVHVAAMLMVGIMAFLGSLILFVHYYAAKDLCTPCPDIPHVASLINKNPPKGDVLSDLDKLMNPEGLTNLWKKEIQDNEKTFKILLTGVTGYVGRAFLYQLLREIATAEKNGKKTLPHKVYVMARGKARKNLTASDRLTGIRDEPMFAEFQKQWDDVVVAAQSGDLQEPKCGMSDEVVQMLTDAELTHVVHCAADVNFQRPLPDSAGINITPALQLQALAATWPSCTRFVHCSTAFVNPGPGTDEKPCAETLFDIGKYDPQELYDSMRGDQKLALEFKKEFGFPNNYVVTKCVAEHLVARHNDSTKMELRICRPAVVGPAWILPEQGWNGDKPSTISGVFLLWGTRVIRFAPLVSRPMPVVPVDVVAAGIIHAMIAPAAEKKDNEYPVSLRNLIWSHRSPKEFVWGTTVAKGSVHSAFQFNYFCAAEAALSFFLVDMTAAYPACFDFLHTIFNLGPLYLLQFICWSLKVSGIKTVLDQVPVVKLFKFSDMLTLYKPYMGREFKFASSINIPESYSMPRYGASLLVATHNFWSKLFPGTIQRIDECDLLPRGRFDLWWALTQPCTSFKARLLGFFACKILRASCTSAALDLLTIEAVFTKMEEVHKSLEEKKHCIVMTPTENSVMDYILVKYVVLFFCSLGIEVPQVVTKKEFADPKCTERLSQSASTSAHNNISLAAFLDGTPGSDGKVPKDMVESLEKIAKVDADETTLIPLSLSYKSLSDSEILLDATKESSDIGLFEMFSLYWQICVMGKTKPSSMGDVRMKFGTPVSLESSSDLDAVASNLHSQLQRLSSPSIPSN